ncbi:MAG: Serine/threonine-protein kinase PknB [Acidobacteriaceae bacterium]|nr:Serine/threonine-protein kinase PknB [Acidobacteriaceae bacterium]
MHKRNQHLGPPDRANPGNPASVGAATKGDSAVSNPAIDPDATLIDLGQAPPASDATLENVDDTVVDTIQTFRAPGRGPARLQNVPVLQTGEVRAGRYEILQLLGEGGMGAVYKAMDHELDRPVALKLIRPELAANPSILARFKQELLLAHQVTHKNVIRIYDLGDDDGVKFITMEFVEGQDLRSLILERKKFPPNDAVEIIQQVCRALEAAHSVGIIHRDLKPQNVMRDRTGRILVMDFGLARTFAGDGMTQTGALVGTMEYMSPEQALAKDLDQRSDLFTLGLIFYELLAGVTPFKAESAVASLIKRNQERAVPLSDHDGTIPPALSNIVSKCLERDPDLRYQNAGDLLRDLDAWQGQGAAATLGFRAVRTWGEGIWAWIGAGMVIIILATTGILYRHELFSGSESRPAVQPQISLTILPFRNASGDRSLDWLSTTVAEMLRTDIGQSSTLRTVPSDRVSQVLHDLRIQPDANPGPDTLRRVAEFTSADRMLWGQYLKFDGHIRIDATLQDLKQQRNFTMNAEAGSEKDLPKVLQQLAESIEKNLALPAETIKELQAKSLKPSSQSVQALRYYGEGLPLLRQGKYLEAQESFQGAVQEDPSFALAYAKLGQVYSNLGYGNEAEQSTRKAVDLSQSLPLHEKYLIAAMHAQSLNDNKKAVEGYESLAKALPEDSDVQFALAGLYTTLGSFDKARASYDELLARDPKYVEALYGRGGVEISAGNSQAALEYLNRAVSLTIELGNDQEQSRLLYALGVAYSQLSKPEEALRNYKNALEIQRRLGAKHDLAMTLNGMGQIQDALGESAEVLKSFQEALALRRELGDKAGIGDTLIDLSGFYEARGRNEEALNVLKESLQIQRERGNQAYEALCLSNIGVNYADEGRYEDALTYLTQGAELREKLKDPGEMADSNFALAETLTKLGQYDQALPHYMKALELWRSLNDKRHEAYASYGLGNLFEQQGRLGAALDAVTEGLRTIREVQDRIGTAEMLGGYGNSLALLGKSQEAEKDLGEAVGLSREVKNLSLVGQNLNFQGDSAFYQGDFKAAGKFYQQALQVASQTTNRRLRLTSKFNLAKVAVKQGNSREPVAVLRGLAEQADAAGLKYLSVECSVYLGEAQMNQKDYSKAQEELNRALARSEKLGLQILQVKSRYLMATTLRLNGKGAEASRNYADAHRILDEMSEEAKSDTFLRRNDLSAIYAESAKWSQLPPAVASANPR